MCKAHSASQPTNDANNDAIHLNGSLTMSGRLRFRVGTTSEPLPSSVMSSDTMAAGGAAAGGG